MFSWPKNSLDTHCSIHCFKKAEEDIAKGSIVKLSQSIALVPNLINKKNEAGLTLLHTAIMFGQVEIAKLLIDKGANIDLVTTNDNSSLHFAVLFGQVEIAKLLIDKGANVNLLGNAGKTPLHFAVEFKREKIVELLIDKGVDFNITDNAGNTASEIAKKNGFYETLFSQGKIKSLTKDVEEGRIEKLSKYIALLPNLINETNEDGFTLLHTAIIFGQVEIAKWLINNGANINLVTTNGNSSLHGAVLFGQEEIVKLLIAKASKVNLADNTGKTALHFAMEFKRKEIAKCLIHKGADVNLANNAGKTPLEIAKGNGFEETLEFNELNLSESNFELNLNGEND
ncbi:MAG: ankyrin repeat domain-containing protein [Rickettsiaceae bacterium]|nr:ankyrin repeat domain-containing protein [Rickettsiaceae bacterium]